ncbi:uncharacterized protein BT62DRAFT_1078873 [Guyanagaster necrorhizus]|uniref:Pentatricopeptide repeat-containing protein n=1 Tax=Guyanagaster necrorhizus TaxID=856835 RepID=A0A9P8APN1_9AGAR|nr:uncharacterized protein BT62DRAFT_1078873 [Guyanagaster necrorhizus MCA 3950]KAG7443149.1 hypothetical protein BT62DRAFT_1078873 [Guyanagaster necrorhizus MCA 3950]
MFLCRRQLSRVVFHNLLSCTRQVACRKYTKNAGSPAAQAVPSVQSSSLTRSSSSQSDEYPTTSYPIISRQTRRKPKHLTLDGYFQMRTQDLQAIAFLPVDAYLDILDDRPLSLNQYKTIVSDVLQIYKGSTGDQMAVIRSITQSGHFFNLSPEDVLALVQRLDQLFGGLEKADRGLFERLLGKLHPSRTVAHLELLDMLHPVLMYHLEEHPLPPKKTSIPYRPSQLIRKSGFYIRALLIADKRDKVLEVFQALMEKQFVQPIPELSASQEFGVIVLLTLTKAWFHWDWRNVGMLLLLDGVRQPNAFEAAIAPTTHRLIADCVHQCVQNARYHELGQCLELLFQLRFISPLPDNIIHALYIALKTYEFFDLGLKLYGLVNKDSVIEHHSYPPPPSKVLLWLLRSIDNQSSGSRLARILAGAVVNQNVDLPVEDRAHFIAILAKNGFGNLARTLWLRYSTGPDKAFVTGNATCMIRMVSIFTHLRKRLEAPEGRQLTRIPDPALSRERDAEYATFVDHVLAEWSLVHTPLTAASHENLTSFARANFIAGRQSDVFSVYEILLERREIPDLYDVNVVLRALAERHPRAAARMIERMIEKGLQPDGVTFGTVLHQALVHNDLSLFQDLLLRLGEMQVVLTEKALVSFVRANATFSVTAAPDVQRKKFLGILSVVTAMKHTGITSSPHLGKFLVYAALKAGLAVFAYRFWKVLLSGSAQWDDDEQGQLRSTLISNIRSRWRKGALAEGRARLMLRHLAGRNCNRT